MVMDAAFLETAERTAPEVLKAVLFESRVAAKQMRKATGHADMSEKQKADPTLMMSQLSSHQKGKVVLDTASSMFMQREVLGRFLEDCLEDSKEGKNSRIALLKTIAGALPKDLVIESRGLTGVIVVPVRSENAGDWQRMVAEQLGASRPAIEGELVEAPWMR